MGVVLLASVAAHAQEHVRLMPQLGMGDVTSVAFSPDGRSVLTGSDGKTARLWDAGTPRHFTGGWTRPRLVTMLKRVSAA
jgi:WD40 repeat protein